MPWSLDVTKGALLADIKHTQTILDKDTYYHQLVCVCVCVCVCEQSGCTTGTTVRGDSLEVEVYLFEGDTERFHPWDRFCVALL